MNYPIDVTPYYRKRKKTFYGSVGLLILHLTAGGVVFVTVYTIGWVISYYVGYLAQFHKSPDEITAVMSIIELALVWIDAALSAVVLIVGSIRFCRDVLEG